MSTAHLRQPVLLNFDDSAGQLRTGLDINLSDWQEKYVLAVHGQNLTA